MIREGSLFTGAGGGLYGSRLLGWQTKFMVEKDDYCQKVLRARQEEGWFDECPIFDDVFEFDGIPWRGKIDVLTAGFPCQPYSKAGKQLGSADERDGWDHTARLIREISPPVILLENVANLLALPRWSDVLGDLASMGYDATWGVFGAEDVDAHHPRGRAWVLCWSPGDRARRVLCSERSDLVQRGYRVRQRRSRGCEARSGRRHCSIPERNGDADEDADLDEKRCKEHGFSIEASQANYPAGRSGQWAFEPPVGRVAYGVANRVNRVSALGNGQVPQQMVVAVRSLFSIALEHM